jgi:hypothetical protein
MSITGFLAKQMAHMVLDTLYMSIIQLAAGRDPAELMKEWQEDPATTAIRYISRFPGLGLWGAVAGQFVAQIMVQLIMNERGMSMSLGPVALSAWESVIKKISKLPKNIAEGDVGESAETLIASLMRMIPFVGGAMTRTIAQILNNGVMGGDMMGDAGGGGGSGRGRGNIDNLSRYINRENQKLLAPDQNSPTQEQHRKKTTQDVMWHNTDTEFLINIIKELGGQRTAPPKPIPQGALGSGVQGVQQQGQPVNPTKPVQGNTGPPQPVGGSNTSTSTPPATDGSIIDVIDNPSPKPAPEGL